MKILAISGSNKTISPSLNNALIAAAIDLCPEGVEIELVDIINIPMFSVDIENNPPEVAKSFKTHLAESDAVLIATPEYNRSIPPVLKNAIDWATRPSGENLWLHKPVAVMGASGGMLGTIAAQLHLRQILLHLGAYVLPSPQMVVSLANDKIIDGSLVDEETRSRLEQFMKEFVDYAGKLKS